MSYVLNQVLLFDEEDINNNYENESDKNLGPENYAAVQIVQSLDKCAWCNAYQSSE